MKFGTSGSTLEVFRKCSFVSYRCDITFNLHANEMELSKQKRSWSKECVHNVQYRTTAIENISDRVHLQQHFFFAIASRPV